MPVARKTTVPEPDRPLVIGVMGTGQVSAKAAIALVDDYIGAREDVGFIFSAAAVDQELPSAVTALAGYANVNDIPYEVIVDQTTGKGADALTPTASNVITSVRAVNSLTTTLANYADGGDEVVLLIAFDEDDEEAYQGLSRALDNEIKCLDLADALEPLEFEDEESADLDAVAETVALATPVVPDDEDEKSNYLSRGTRADDEDEGHAIMQEYGIAEQDEEEPLTDEDEDTSVNREGLPADPDKLKIRELRTLVRERTSIPTRKVGQMTMKECIALLYPDQLYKDAPPAVGNLRHRPIPVDQDGYTEDGAQELTEGNRMQTHAVSDIRVLDEAQNFTSGAPDPNGLPPAGIVREDGAVQQLGRTPAGLRVESQTLSPSEALHAIAEARDAVFEQYAWADGLVAVIAQAVANKILPQINLALGGTAAHIIHEVQSELHKAAGGE